MVLFSQKVEERPKLKNFIPSCPKTQRILYDRSLEIFNSSHRFCRICQLSRILILFNFRGSSHIFVKLNLKDPSKNSANTPLRLLEVTKVSHSHHNQPNN
ncbi:hypothetical protein FF021_08525 [Leptospira noguchii]|nr:hypothetical protein FF021_08525 [Leptospira noguchii]